MKIYNSLSRKIEDFVPKHKNKVNMYVCGPTVYDDIHIGNGRPVVFFDVVKRYLEYKGFDVTYATNITDIDDKIIDRAISKGVNELEISTKYANSFMKVLEGLDVDIPDFTPHATDYVDNMISFIDDLIKKGFAYQIPSGVYFRVNKIKDYGVLSNQKIEDLIEGSRIDVDPNKENFIDFALWKNTDVGIKYKSPWGYGRPGWHTECVVMNLELFGDDLDIHGGGFDLKFPHHENEIAQSMACKSHHLAKYWMHVGRLDFNEDKMSKSLGNVIKIKDLLKEHNANAYKLLILAHHYGQPINFTYELLTQYETIYDKISYTLNRTLFNLMLNNNYDSNMRDDYLKRFELLMDDDYNTPLVITLIDEILKELNKTPNSSSYHQLINILDVLGILPNINEPTKEDLNLFILWEEDRLNKNYQEADKKRNYLTNKRWI